MVTHPNFLPRDFTRSLAFYARISSSLVASFPAKPRDLDFLLGCGGWGISYGTSSINMPYCAASCWDSSCDGSMNIVSPGIYTSSPSCVPCRPRLKSYESDFSVCLGMGITTGMINVGHGGLLISTGSCSVDRGEVNVAAGQNPPELVTCC